MAIYIVNVIGLSLIALLFKLAKINSRETKNIFLWITTVQLILLQALRADNIGADTETYLIYYREIRDYTFKQFWEQRFEFGFKAITWIISELNVNEQVYLMIISACIIIPVSLFINRYSENVCLSYYLYITLGFYGASFCTLRQNMAYGIALFSVKAIQEKKFFKFLGIVIGASLFHTSVIFFILAYPLAQLGTSRSRILKIGIAGLLILQCRRAIVVWLTTRFLPAYNVVESTSYNWFIFNMLLFLLLFFYYTKATRLTLEETSGRQNEISAYNRIYYMLILVGILLMLFATVANNAMRIVNYYYIYIIILIPSMIKRISCPFEKVFIKTLIIIGLAIIYIYFLSEPSDYAIVPYQFFWTQ